MTAITSPGVNPNWLRMASKLVRSSHAIWMMRSSSCVDQLRRMLNGVAFKPTDGCGKFSVVMAQLGNQAMPNRNRNLPKSFTGQVRSGLFQLMLWSFGSARDSSPNGEGNPESIEAVAAFSNGMRRL
jgi:hypothetical protein